MLLKRNSRPVRIVAQLRDCGWLRSALRSGLVGKTRSQQAFYRDTLICTYFVLIIDRTCRHGLAPVIRIEMTLRPGFTSFAGTK